MKTSPSHALPTASLGTDSDLARLLLLGSVMAIGHAIIQYHGGYTPTAFRWIMIAFALALAPGILPRLASVDRIVGHHFLRPAFAVAIAYEFAVAASVDPGRNQIPRPGYEMGDFHFALGGLAVLAGLVVAARVPRPWLWAPAVLAGYFVLGTWMLRISPAPHIDVFPIHQESIEALLHGKNPYAISFANIYHNTDSYAPATATVDRLNFGYVYPAWNLLVGLPGYVLARDYRFGFLAAILISAGLIAFSGRDRWTVAAMIVFLFNSRSFLVIEQGWTEPPLLLGIAIAVFAASRRRTHLLAVGLGIVLVAKQYSVLAAPAALLLRPLLPSWRAYARVMLEALVVAALLTVPFVLPDPKAFWHAVYGMQFSAPFRPDALSIPVAWQDHYGTPMPKLLQLVGPLLLGIFTIVRARRTPAGLAWAGATLYFTFFLFRQGFCNYFYLVIAIYCLAVAAHRGPGAQVAEQWAR